MIPRCDLKEASELLQEACAGHGGNEGGGLDASLVACTRQALAADAGRQGQGYLLGR